MNNELLVGLTLLVVLTVGGQVVATRLRLPSILVLLALGILAGPVLGVVEPDALLGDLLFPTVSLAVSLVLFEGGLLLDLRELRRGASGVVRRLLLVTLPVTFVAGSVAAVLLLDVSAEIAVVLGAILTVSGPTVVLPLLHFIRPDPRVAAILKWEGMFVDALGATLAVVVFEAVLAAEDTSLVELLAGVAGTVAVGAVTGVVAAIALVWLLNSSLVDEPSAPTVTILLVLAAYTAAHLLRAEAGLSAAIVMGVVLANQRRVAVRRVEEFKETLGPLLTGLLFVILSARLDLDELREVLLPATVLVAVLVLVVRPLATSLATLGTPTSRSERLLIAWMAPRGIVAAATASLFGIQLAEEGISGAEDLAPITFLVILGTVAVYGLTGPSVARSLRLTRDARLRLLVVGDDTTSREIAQAFATLGVAVTHVSSHRVLGHHDHDRVLDHDRAVVVGGDPDANRDASRWLARHMDTADVFELPVRSRPSGPQAWLPPSPFGPGESHETISTRLTVGDELVLRLPHQEGDDTDAVVVHCLS